MTHYHEPVPPPHEPHDGAAFLTGWTAALVAIVVAVVVLVVALAATGVFEGGDGRTVPADAPIEVTIEPAD